MVAAPKRGSRQTRPLSRLTSIALAVVAILLVAPAVLGAAAPGGAVAPPAPSAAAEEITGILFGLFVLLLAAKLGEEVLRRLGQPGVVGELLGGFIVGPFGLGLVQPGETALVFAEMGVVILLFSVGLEVRTDDLLKVGKPAILTALLGMLLPIAAGFALVAALGEPTLASLFVGLALAATSIGITSRVLRDIGVMDRTFARVVIGAALVDDILALVLIGLAAGAAEGDLSASTLLVGVAGIGLVVLGFAIARRARGVKSEVFTWPLFADTPLVPSFLIMLATALLATLVGLAAIIGAFVAGLVVAETEAADELEHDIKPLASIFVPFFFAVTGAQLDLSALLDPPIAALAIALAVIGIVTKALGGFIGARSIGKWGATTVGFGMVPRGEVGIVVANLALATGVVTGDLFAAMVVAVVLTTVAAPYLLAWSIPKAEAETAAAAVAPGTPPA
ncbi:MAG TPA: cation:proton antiporter [Candidatus Limnocylindrales bacterium]|nr:cation:proton antiporter [Candidatus Limnocylindrales bacterium]